VAVNRELTHFLKVSTNPIRVIAAIVARGDKLLVCQRPAHKRHGGLWEFPGGKCEPRESDREAISRELHEELGVEVLAVDPEEFAIDDPDSPFRIAFLPVSIAGEPVCREHSALRWGALDEIAQLPLAPSDRRFVDSLINAASVRKTALRDLGAE
jgi:mutator protein MutT